MTTYELEGINPIDMENMCEQELVNNRSTTITAAGLFTPCDIKHMDTSVPVKKRRMKKSDAL